MSIGTCRTIQGLWPDGLKVDPLAGYLARGLSATLVVRLTTLGLSFVTLIVLMVAAYRTRHMEIRYGSE